MATASGTSAPPAAPAQPQLSARIVCTVNSVDEEPWLPVKSIVTQFKIQVASGDANWEVLRRYSDFHDLNDRLAQHCGISSLPELPPKLLMNQARSPPPQWKGVPSPLHPTLYPLLPLFPRSRRTSPADISSWTRTYARCSPTSSWAGTPASWSFSVRRSRGSGTVFAASSTTRLSPRAIGIFATATCEPPPGPRSRPSERVRPGLLAPLA